MASEYLKRKPTTTGNRRKWTLSGWVKIHKDFGGSDYNTVWSVAAGTSGDNSDRFHLYHYSSGKWVTTGTTSFSQIFTAPDGSVAQSRDPAGWMHICLSVDTTLTSNSRDQIQRFWINGVEYIYDDGGNLGQNVIQAINGPFDHFLGSRDSSPSRVYDGEMFDFYLVDGQALTADKFAFAKEGDGYQSSGTQYSTNFTSGQWSPRLPKSVKFEINRNGGFGVNGFYLPMNDSSNPGADFHCTPNTIIKLKGEDLPQPQNGVPETTDAYVSQLRKEKGELGFDGVCKFDGDTDTLEFANSTDFEIESSDFCMEAFIFTTEIKNAGIFGNNQSTGPAAGYEFDIKNDGALNFYSGNGSSYNNTSLGAQSPAGVIKTGRWYHIAAVRNGNNFRIYVDGSRVAENTSFTHTAASTNTPFRLGSDGASVGSAWHFNGLISNARIVKGSPVYTANFTPPTEPLTAINNTKLLCCQSSTDASTVAVSPGATTVNSDVIATVSELTAYVMIAIPGASTSTGSNLISNGNFEKNITGWGAGNGATLSHEYSGPSLNGNVRVQSNGSSNGYASQIVSTNQGQRYTLSFLYNFVSGNQEGYVNISSGSIGGSDITYKTLNTNAGWQLFNLSFTATSNSTFIGFYSRPSGGGVTRYTNIVLKSEDVPGDYSADIKGTGSNYAVTPVELTASQKHGAGVGYDIPSYYGSAMSFAGDGDHLEINTPALGSGDWTIEEWFKQRSGTTVQGYWDVSLGVNGDSNTVGGASIYHTNGAGLGPAGEVSFIGNTNAYRLYTGVDHRDDCWHHVAVVKYNNVVTLYLDGVAKGKQADSSNYNSTNNTLIGCSRTDEYNFFEGQISDIRVYKGVAKYKGSFDVSRPYAPMNFEGDNWRTTLDNSKNNFATLSTVAKGANVTYFNGNLSSTSGTSNNRGPSVATMGITSGKWYWEFVANSTGSHNALSGIVGLGPDLTDGKYVGYTDQYGVGYYAATGETYIAYGGALTSPAYGSSWTNGDVIGVAIDMSGNGSVTFYKNGASQGVAATGLGAYLTTGEIQAWVPGFGDGSASQDITHHVNFGQNPTFCGQKTAGTFTDANSKGLFYYEPPSGHLALCTDNLPTPEISDPGKYFKTVLYRGTGEGGLEINKVGFQPDMVWIKHRGSINAGAGLSHNIYDSVRGTCQRLQPDLSNGQSDLFSGSESGGVTSFNPDGFTLGNGTDDCNFTTGRNYVAWCWKAGGPAVTNTEGDITTQVSANPEAGFSIVRSPGPGTSGHGLNSTPKFIIQKSIGTGNWNVAHTDLYAPGGTGKILLNLTDPVADSSTTYMHNATATTFDPLFGADQIAYVWAEVEGFSKFASYIGNGSANGPFVYCGFRPAFILVKNADSTGHWVLWDSSRTPYNNAENALRVDGNYTETSGFIIDFLSNGFKLRDGETSLNNTSENHIFAAFAESPFKTANAK